MQRRRAPLLALHVALRVAIVVTVVLVRPARALASPLIDLAGGADGLGGMQARTMGGGPSAAYFNPALLTEAPFGFTLGFVVLGEQLGVDLDGRPGTQYAVPGGIANGTHADGSPLPGVPIPTGDLQNGRAKQGINPAVNARPRQGAGSGHAAYTYELIGFAAKLFDETLTVGFFGMIPNGNFTSLSAFYPDEREQYFSNSLHPELYGDRLSAVSISFGLGWKIDEHWSVGLGGSLSLQAAVGAPTFVANAGALQDLKIDTDAAVNMSISPNLGVAWKPSSRWHLTGTVHAPEKVELGVNFTFLLPNGLQQGSQFELLYDDMPWRFGLGGAYDIVQHARESLSLAGTIVYEKWSDYRDRHGEAPIAPFGWYDVVTPTVGVRYTRGPAGFFVDGQYKPTPVPPQTGRSNYVDNDRLGASIGVEYGFTVLHTGMKVGAQAQAYWLMPRHQTKIPTPNEPDGANHYPALVTDEVPDDTTVGGEKLAGGAGLQTNNPGWPGFGSQGVIASAGLYLTVTP